MALFHVFETVENSRTGVPMAGVQVRAKYDDTDQIAPIYASQEGDAFDPANYVVTDNTGMYSFYIDGGEYSLEYLIGGEIIRTIPNFRPAEIGPSGPANSTYETTAALELADTANVSAILSEPGKAGTFTIRDYVDFTAEVTADTGKVNYIRSTLEPTKVWVRTSILSTAASQIGAASGLTVDDELSAKATLSGVARSATNLGTFTGVTIPDASTIKGALQAVETAVESVAGGDATKANASAIGIAATDVNLGTFTGTTIPDASTAKAALQALETAQEAASADIALRQTIAALAASSGGSTVGVIQSGTGAVAETLQTVARRRVYAKQYGVVADYNTGTGTGTDDSAAFANAIAALGAGGGTVIVDKGSKCLIDANLNLPDNVIIEAEGNGLRGDYNDQEANLLTWASALYVNSSATITLNASSGIRNIAIFRKGLAFNITAAQVASTFQGSAITLAPLSSDVVLEYLTIIGFQYAIRTVPGINRSNRVQIHHVNIDCLNGVYLENAADTSRISYVHCWPFVTVGSAAEANSAQLLRSGVAFYIGGTINDWCDVAHCFSYGYSVGYQTAGDVNSVCFDGCGADHVPGLTDGAIGYLIGGNSREVRIVNGQVAAKQYGIKVDSTYANTREACNISNTNVWSTTTAAIWITDGDVNISGGFLRTGASGILTGASSGKVTVDGVDFRAITTALNNNSSSINLQHRNCTFNTVSTIAVNPYVPTVASASSIVLDGENVSFSVTGTTNCGTLSPVAAYAGKTVSLKFAAGLQMINGGNMKLAGGVNFVATADDTLTLTSDGTTWYEVGRSVN